MKSAVAAVALPWLEAMTPTAEALGVTRNAGMAAASPAAAPSRLAFMYMPNGVIADTWFPKKTGTDFELPATLKPLEHLRNDINVISGLNRTYLTGEPHSQAGSCWLTSALPNQRKDGVTAINTTLDQVVARHPSNGAAFPSLELSCNTFVDNMEPKLFDAISWYGPGNNAKSLNDPQKVFKRLFGNSGSVDESILDTLLDEAQQLNKKLGANDQRKMNEYLESVRAIEKRIGIQKDSKDKIADLNLEMPANVPVERGEFIRLMGDMMVLAFRTDQTRVATFMIGPERWQTPQLYEGVFDKPVNHHIMTHDTACDDQVSLIDQFHVQQYAYLVDQLKEIPEGEGSLLDNCSFVLGSGLGNGARHSYEQLPLVMAGSGGGKFETGRHVMAAKGTPLANLWLSLAGNMGLNLEEFADSTGRLAEL